MDLELTKLKSYKHAINLLCKRDYSRFKLKEKLQKKLFKEQESTEHLEDVLDLLIEKKYLREDQYQEARVKGLMNKYYSPEYIKQKMEQENCPTPMEFIEHIFSEYQNTRENQIIYLVEKKIPTILPTEFNEKMKLKAKLLRFLLSKGHDTSLSSQVIDNTL